MRARAAALAAVGALSDAVADEEPPLPGAGETTVVEMEFGGEERTFAICKLQLSRLWVAGVSREAACADVPLCGWACTGG